MSQQRQLNQEAIAWLVNSLTAGELFEFLRSLSPGADHLFRGFKVSRETVSKPLFLKRLKTELNRSAEFLDIFLNNTSSPWGKWERALRCLDETWLQRNWTMLLRDGASPALAIAMFQDPRESIHNRGSRALNRTNFLNIAKEWQEHPIDMLPAAPLALIDLLAPTENASPETATPNNDKPKQQNDRELKKLTESRDRAKAKARQAEEDLKLFKQQQDEQQRELRRAIRTLTQENHDLQCSIELETQQRLNQFRRETLGVTDEIRQQRKTLQTDNTSQLLERTADLLLQQTQLNEKHGILSELRHEISTVKQALSDIDACLAESIVILPELEHLRDNLANRAEELCALLPIADETKPELATELLGQIQRATASPDGQQHLNNIQHALRLTPIREALGKHWLRELQQALADREQTLDNLIAQTELAKSHPPPSSKQQHSPKEIWNVSAELDNNQNQPVHLLLDGYNLTKSIEHFIKLENQLGLPATREELAKLCKPAAERFAQLEIVYDGEAALTRCETDGPLTITYAPKLQESQNADNYIVKKATEITSTPARIWIVTNDYGLRARLNQTCHAFISTDDFYNFICSD